MIPKPNTAKSTTQFHLTLYLAFGGTQLVIIYTLKLHKAKEATDY